MSEKKKVLIIDDEAELCVMVKENLEERGGYEVTTTSDTQGVERLVKQIQPDVILLDVVMPGRKGTDLVAAFKSDPEIKQIPLIIVSGKGEMVYDKKKDEFKWLPNSKLVRDRGEMPNIKGAEALAEYYKVADYVSKPFTTEVLIQVIADVLAKYRKVTEKTDEEPPV